MTHDESAYSPDLEPTIVKPAPSTRLDTRAGSAYAFDPLESFAQHPGEPATADGSGFGGGGGDPALNAFGDLGGSGKREPSFTEPADLTELLSGGGALNPLVQACAPLLHAAAHLRASTRATQAAALRDTLARAVRRFEIDAHRNGVSQEATLAARYILCTLIDEAACSTPWGAALWPQYSLLVMFHNEARGGSKVFQLLTCFAEDPARHIDLLELVALTLALGFEGQYRVHENGQHALDLLRRRLSEIIRAQRGAPCAELSPHWQPASAPPRRVTDVVPSWLVAAAAGLMLAGVFVAFSVSINRVSDPVFADIAAIRTPAAVVPSSAAPDLAVPDAATRHPRLASLLAPDLAAGRIDLKELPDRTVTTLAGDATFAPGSARLEAPAEALVARVAAALSDLPGKVLVGGHTDGIAVHSARYASNWQLSRERAEGVRARLADTIGAARVEAQGFADTAPVASDDTYAGRARNRRVEITLFAKPG
ncbi:type IVB secretion system protein IcmH/DotU [Caballeronia sp. BR00000012568055]|uniref:type IVB secretion system protein IcmH/DotU n=1 Tax=Caballeronia sp. BR00000012568055 TaxID=2918761 RepID=UPI0023F79C80|nr:type IVB secretion system protein IcmH/DotU [Caballeronia sp. BR00000012568055]